ncbi:hypothetical protein KL914_001659 [Ogataea haglerorum]|nr:hypothetical protein KL914_001659 [Ogataea haglerorum]
MQDKHKSQTAESHDYWLCKIFCHDKIQLSLEEMSIGYSDPTFGESAAFLPMDRAVAGQTRPSLRHNSSLSRGNIHRRSSIIMADTGQKIQRSYSFWDQTQDEIELESQIENNRRNVEDRIQGFQGRLKGVIYSDTCRGVLKGALAYFVASWAVYSTTLSSILGNADSKHLICTIVVYFHPTRTKGSMIQSLIFVILSLSFAFSISVILMSISSKSYNMESPELGYGIDLVFSCAALGLISLTKQWVNKPTFNTACSLSAIVIISCVIKEGSQDGSVVPWTKIGSIFRIVLAGCIVSALTCYLLWPTSAEAKLKQHLNENADVQSRLLKLVSRSFLGYDHIDSSETNELVEKVKSSLKNLKKYLEEAKFELYLKGKEKEYHLLEDLVESCGKLWMTMAGMRMSVEFKYELLDTSNRVHTEATSLHSYYGGQFDGNTSNESDFDDEAVAIDSKELFDLFVYHLGPSIKSFSYTVRQILSGVPFNSDNEIEPAVEQYSKSLALAKDLYSENHLKALKKLYDQDLFKTETDFDSKVDQEEVAASCGNFSFLLLEFSSELSEYLRILKELNAVSTYDDTKSFEFLKFWKRSFSLSSTAPRNSTINDMILRIQGTNEDYSAKMSLNYRVWRVVKILRSVDVQFGLRVGIGSLFIAIFAYIDKTKDFFDDWRGEWALVTFCIIMNKSVGGTTMTIKWRFLGTFLGAFTAYCVWVLLYPNALLMAVVGFLFSIGCFHIIINWEANNAFGRFILLTYNLTVLYSWTMANKVIDKVPDYDDEGGDNPIIFEIAIHRFLGVSFGVIWALIVTMSLFPNSARSRIRRGLSILWLRMGIIWHSGPLAYEVDEHNEYRLIGIRDRKTIHMIMAELETLLKQAPMEIRLKGPFPIGIYEKLLISTSRIIDAFENLNSIIEINKKLTPNEHSVLQSLAGEMSELENRVFLIFYMLASAMKLGFPLANKPASTEHSKERMLAKLSEIRKRSTSEKQVLSDEDFVLLYTYNLVTNSITNELDVLLGLVADLYGRVSEETLEL